MHTEKLHIRIQHLEKKILQLLTQHKALQETMHQLRKDKEQLTQQLTQKAITGDHSPALTTDMISKYQIKDWGAQIDSYIRDIDKVIAYLERLPS